MIRLDYEGSQLCGCHALRHLDVDGLVSVRCQGCAVDLDGLDGTVGLCTLGGGSEVAGLRARVGQIAVGVQTGEVTADSRSNLVGLVCDVGSLQCRVSQIQAVLNALSQVGLWDTA